MIEARLGVRKPARDPAITFNTTTASRAVVTLGTLRGRSGQGPLENHHRFSIRPTDITSGSEACDVSISLEGLRTCITKDPHELITAKETKSTPLLSESYLLERLFSIYFGVETLGLPKALPVRSSGCYRRTGNKKFIVFVRDQISRL